MFSASLLRSRLIVSRADYSFDWKIFRVRSLKNIIVLSSVRVCDTSRDLMKLLNSALYFQIRDDSEMFFLNSWCLLILRWFALILCIIFLRLHWTKSDLKTVIRANFWDHCSSLQILRMIWFRAVLFIFRARFSLKRLIIFKYEWICLVIICISSLLKSYAIINSFLEWLWALSWESYQASDCWSWDMIKWICKQSC